jgi:hypothetical protein
MIVLENEIYQVENGGDESAGISPKVSVLTTLILLH